MVHINTIALRLNFDQKSTSVSLILLVCCMLAGVILGLFEVIGFISIKRANYGIVKSYDNGFQIDQGVRINEAIRMALQDQP